MSTQLDNGYYHREFDLSDEVSFLHAGERMIGTVVRVYNSRAWYHVESDGIRYSVHICDDDMQLVT